MTELNKETLFHNREAAKQLVDFSGVCIDKHIYPTNIDGIIEYKNKMYILFEVKYSGSEVPFGQRLALERMVKDFTKAGKDAIVFIASHDTKNPDDDVDAESCFVTEFYSGSLLRWVQVKDVLVTLGVATKAFKNNPLAFFDAVGCKYRPVKLLEKTNKVQENKEAEVIGCAS